ncbi:glycosyltransferase [Pseudomaricurvus sp. HS19]|uniref:glycosyltransferase n=1 Tax=Pseudomaricurvus sp. HS19 TaxID=2692626 RepID=UPI0013702C8D|nr:glycosyltransferase [Pseudomaricurvus sp. HS19]MYM63386.1 glycosyltransferase [Pseudomaricurvus sp. HS19]
MRIVHVAHQQYRKYGYTRVNWAQKLFYGLIKNDHHVQPFSDRDVAAFEAPFGIRDLGVKKSNKRLLQTVEAYQPELVIVGHCDIISNDTLEEVRRLCPGVVIVGCNNDPLFVPENDAKIRHRCDVVDAMFVSTGERELQRYAGARARLLHMPNPVDPSVEFYDASARPAAELKHDLIFCSKSEAYTERGRIVQDIHDNLANRIRFHTPGSFGVPGVWGRDYDLALADSAMGLNLNRQEGLHWYSSARMAQMAGNGVLTFTDGSADFASMFPAETLVYFDSVEELKEKLLAFHHDDDMRRHWAGNCRQYFHREINNKLYAQYIVEASMQLPFSHPYVWQENHG